MSNEEEVIGTHTGLHYSGITLEEGRNSTRRNLCTNCKRDVHTFVKVDKETREAVIHKTCTNTECVCKCKTHFECRNCGYLHPYGSTCNRQEVDTLRDLKADEEFEKIMDEWRDNR